MLTSAKYCSKLNNMKSNNLHQMSHMVRIQLSDEEKTAARNIAKNQGMTFQGWLGKIIRQEISRESQHDAS